MNGRHLLLSAWEPGLAVPLLCAAALLGYLALFRGRLSKRAGFFAAAVALFFLALASPIAVLARGYLFSAHMLQHLLLVLAVPALALLGLPRIAGSPTAPRQAPGPVVPWLAGVGAMWLWHVPTLCNAAAVSAPVQALQTGTLLLLGLYFWQPILSPRAQARFEPFTAMLYLFTACVACSILGVLLTFSPIEVCSAYLRPEDRLGVLPLLRDRWGISCAVDQQLGGLLMWVPPCVIYAGAIVAILAGYLREEGSRGGGFSEAAE